VIATAGGYALALFSCAALWPIEEMPHDDGIRLPAGCAADGSRAGSGGGGGVRVTHMGELR
jgi:hypothetical protein